MTCSLLFRMKTIYHFISFQYFSTYMCICKKLYIYVHVCYKPVYTF